MLKFILLLPLFFASHTYSMSLDQDSVCPKHLEELPIQSGGRDKPYEVFAKEALKFISGKKSLQNLSAAQVICLLSFESIGRPFETNLPVKLEHIKTKELLSKGGDFLMARELVLLTDLIRQELPLSKADKSYRKDLQKTLSKIELYTSLRNGLAWTLPIKNKKQINWVPFVEYMGQERVTSVNSEDPFAYLFAQATQDYQSIKGKDYLLERHYFRAQYFTWSILVSLLAIVFAVALKGKPWVFLSMSLLSILLQTLGITLRVLISQRAPITNMYETVMFSGLGALIIALILFFYGRRHLFLISGLAYNILCLMMMKFANNMLDPSISPLVPVLRSNFWLSTHVTTVILSYAALALSWILANIVLFKQAFLHTDKNETREQTQLIYTCIKVGVVLLAGGIILGGVWADYSWGRFWGWDPKEVGSLVVLLVYTAILHGRYTNWIPPKRFISMVSAAFLTVMMAWFGVNYILASGLHSYGFSQGGAVFLTCYTIIHLGFLFIASFKLSRKSL